MRTSAHPAIWVAAAWGMIPLLLADAVVSTGGAASPALMWFALPAVTLGARFEPRGIAIGTAYILALLRHLHLCPRSRLGRCPPPDRGRRRGAGAEHGDPLGRPGRVRQGPPPPLDGRPADRPLQPQRPRAAPGRARPRRRRAASAASPTPCCSATSTTSSGSTTGSATPPATPSCRRSPTRCATRCARATRSTASAARRSSSSSRGRRSATRSTSPSGCGARSATCGRWE